MINVLDPLPTWLIMLVLALLIFALSEVGFQFGGINLGPMQLAQQSMGAAPSPRP